MHFQDDLQIPAHLCPYVMCNFGKVGKVCILIVISQAN